MDGPPLRYLSKCSTPVELVGRRHEVHQAIVRPVISGPPPSLHRQTAPKNRLNSIPIAVAAHSRMTKPTATSTESSGFFRPICRTSDREIGTTNSADRASKERDCPPPKSAPLDGNQSFTSQFKSHPIAKCEVCKLPESDIAWPKDGAGFPLLSREGCL